jgi:hypothetical protein
MTKLQGTWVLAVANAVLDVVLSVAASVILSLLLISGDVEENPGPVGGIIILCCYDTTISLIYHARIISMFLSLNFIHTQILILIPLIQLN